MEKRWELIRARGTKKQKEVARDIGMSQQTISMWECGAVTPEDSQICKLEEYYQVPKEKLFPDLFILQT